MGDMTDQSNHLGIVRQNGVNRDLIAILEFEFSGLALFFMGQIKIKNSVPFVFFDTPNLNLVEPRGRLKAASHINQLPQIWRFRKFIGGWASDGTRNTGTNPHQRNKNRVAVLEGLILGTITFEKEVV